MSWLSKNLGLDASRSSLRDNQEEAISNLSGLAPQYQQMATRAGTTAEQYNPLRSQAAGSLLDLYRGGFDKGGLLKKKMLGGIDSQFDSAAAKARATALASGMNPSSTLALIGAKKAQATAGALTNYGTAKMGEDERYLKGAYGVVGDMYGNALNEQNSALGHQAGIYGQQYNLWGDQAAQEEARQAQSRQNMMNLIQTGASLYGASMGVPSAPKANPMNGAWQGMGGYTPETSAVSAPQISASPVMRMIRPANSYLAGYDY